MVNQNGFQIQLRRCYKRIRILEQHVLLGMTLTMASVMALAKPGLANIVPNGLDTTIDNQTCTASCTVTDGSTRGSNLFHSFEAFSVPVNSTVTFQHDGAIANIITRVTGDSTSRINGTIRTLLNGSTDDVGTADFFLINPNGIVFGENAQLNIGGSFIGSTAERLQFEDGTEFSVDNANPLLTISVLTGLQFGSNPGNIRVLGTGNGLFLNPDATVNRGDRPSGLEVASDNSLTLIGGNLTVNGGNLTVDSGHIALGAVGDNSIVALAETPSGWVSDYPGVTTFGDIHFLNEASADVSGDTAGTLNLQGQNIILENGSSLLANTLTNGNGAITIQAAESLKMDGMSSIVPSVPFSPIPTSAYIEISSGAVGDGQSELVVNAPLIELTGGAQIGLSMAGAGSSGSLSINAETIIATSGSPTAPSGVFTAVLPVFSDPPATGLGGDLTIVAESLQVLSGAQLRASSFGLGNAGNFTITAQDIDIIGFNPGGPSTLQSSVDVPPGGSGGQLTIDTQRLLVADGGQIATATRSLSQPAGDLTIRASEFIELEGVSDTASRSGLFANAVSARNPITGEVAEAFGEGGSITIETPHLLVRNGATINVSNNPSNPNSPVAAPGNGPAGDLTVVADRIVLSEQGILTADTVNGDRANITLEAEIVSLQDESLITTSATGAATGGNLTINTSTLAAFSNSDITANAVDNFGGRVIIAADGIFGTQFRSSLTSNSDITATSTLGPQFRGIVELNTPEVDPSRGTSELPSGMVNQEAQIVSACEPITASTLVLLGQGGVPPSPLQPIYGESLWQDLRMANAQSQTHGTQDSVSSNDSPHESGARSPHPVSIVEAERWSLGANGQISLVAQAQPSDWILGRQQSQC